MSFGIGLLIKLLLRMGIPQKFAGIAADLILVGVVVGGCWWIVDSIGDRREASVRAEWRAADDARALAAVTVVANDNAALVFDLWEFSENKAAVKTARANRNWEQSERLNNELFAKLGTSQPGSCDGGNIPDVAAAVDWVWREAARAGDQRAVPGPQGGEGSDGAPAGTTATP